MMLKLSDGCAVAASEIAEVVINATSNTITVRMKGGIGHHVGCDYGKTVWATQDRLLTEIDAAQRPVQTEPLLPAIDSLVMWLLGENGDFPKKLTGQGAYHWRPELRKRYYAIKGVQA